MKAVMILTAALFSFGSAGALAACEVEAVEGSADLRVISETAEYQGYVSPNPDGSWFAWVQGEGSVNESFPDEQAATEHVCGNDKAE